MTYRIVALYRFTPIADTAALRARLIEQLQDPSLCGSLLIAPEGINGTLAGSDSAIDLLLDVLKRECGLDPAKDEVKFSHSETQPFKRFKLRLKKEIITFRQPNSDPNIQVGQYVEPQDWNNLISGDDVIVLDTRNLYETKDGTFQNAVVPDINKFTEFAAYVREQLKGQQNKKIAMFCTGGIRCEKASSFMLAEGFPSVYHLKGGILKYLETVPQEQSLWNGECYVFDEREAVGHNLTPRKN